jgi:predicted dehydrogenase
MQGYSDYKVGLIGYGSIGRRHCDNLLSLEVTDISLLREIGNGNGRGLREFSEKESFLTEPFDFIIISNPTALHFEYLRELLPRQINLLVEKPVVSNLHELQKLRNLLQTYNGIGMCAYNMRFHPCVIKTKDLLDDGKIGKVYSARFSVGQYLPDWRPDGDYRLSYSASAKLGGGVILDLIHEIDMAAYFCGPVALDFHAMAARVSDLDIETEDLAEIHYRSAANIFVSIHMDYLARGYSRHFELIGETGSIYCDLFANSVKLNRDTGTAVELFTFENFSRNDMYLSMIRYYLHKLGENVSPVPELRDGLDSLETALKAKSKFQQHE